MQQHPEDSCRNEMKSLTFLGSVCPQHIIINNVPFHYFFHINFLDEAFRFHALAAFHVGLTGKGILLFL